MPLSLFHNTRTSAFKELLVFSIQASHVYERLTPLYTGEFKAHAHTGYIPEVLDDRFS